MLGRNRRGSRTQSVTVRIYMQIVQLDMISTRLSPSFYYLRGLEVLVTAY